MNISKMAREAGINVQTVHSRLRTGWSLEEALTRPVRRAVVTPAEAAETAGLDPVGTQYILRWSGADRAYALGTPTPRETSERFENSPAVEEPRGLCAAEPTSFVARAFADLGSVFRRMLGLS